MGRRTPFQVGPWLLPSKAAARRMEKGIRADWKNRGPLTGKAAQFIRCLIVERYPADWLQDKLVGQGINQIHVGAAPPPFHDQNTCFWITRTAGAEVDISVAKQCFREDTPLDDFRAASRTAVRPWIDSYLQECFAKNADGEGFIACQLSGARLARGQAVVHHDEPTFNEIVDGFIAEIGVDVAQTARDLLGYEDGEAAKRFRDRRLEEEFVTCHAQRARVLLVVDRDAHTKLPRTARAKRVEA